MRIGRPDAVAQFTSNDGFMAGISSTQCLLMAGWRRPCSCPNFDDLIQCLASEGEGLRRNLPPRLPLCGVVACIARIFTS